MCHWNLEGIGGVETGSGVKFILEAACSNHVIGHEWVVLVSVRVSFVSGGVHGFVGP